MAFNWYGWIFISKKEKAFFNSDELRLILYHEQEHNKDLVRKIYTDWRRIELDAQLRACQRMIREGYSAEEVIAYELNYRIYSKYGISLEKFVQKVKELK